jgi:hypothetical protein
MSEKLLGHVSVDSGTISIGDPCYIVGEDYEWKDVCDKFFPDENDRRGENSIEFAGHIMASTLYGDGTYPVYAEYQDGRISGLRIDFDPEF